MFEEAQYFAPVVEHDDGTLKVQLGKGHPGFADEGRVSTTRTIVETVRRAFGVAQPA